MYTVLNRNVPRWNREKSVSNHTKFVDIRNVVVI